MLVDDKDADNDVAFLKREAELLENLALNDPSDSGATVTRSKASVMASIASRLEGLLAGEHPD